MKGYFFKDNRELKIHRYLKYYYLKFLRLKGEPQELAIGMSVGIFIGMMPIMPFQIVSAVGLALLFRGSKITAILGTWISNPFNWFLLYYYNYKVGAFILGLSEKNAIFSSIMTAVKSGEDPMVIVEKIFAGGGIVAATFLLGGLVMGICASVPSFFVSLYVFKYIKSWHQLRKERGKRW